MKNKLLLTFILLSTVNRVLEFSGIFIPFVHSYLDDILVLPIVMGIMLWVFRKYIVNEEYVFPIAYILFSVFLYAYVFEAYLPKHSTRFTSDWRDVVAYGVGGMIFQLMMNIPGSERSSSRST